VTQKFITLTFAAVGAVVYWILALRGDKKCRIEDLLMFGLMCGTVPTGAYLFLGALKHLDQEQTGDPIYMGLLGICLCLFALRKAYDMSCAVLRKRNKTSPNSSQ
jgi:hypothetical protein